jgi:hypothetical protein
LNFFASKVGGRFGTATRHARIHLSRTSRTLQSNDGRHASEPSASVEMILLASGCRASRRLSAHVDLNVALVGREHANWRWRYAYAWETLVNKTPPAFAMERLEKSGCLSFDFMEDDKGYCRLFWHLRKRGVSSMDAQTEALLSLWNALGERASGRGTYVHRQAELHCNSEPFDEDVEMKQYLRFREDNPHLKPYRTEWSVFSYAHGGTHIASINSSWNSCRILAVGGKY